MAGGDNVTWNELDAHCKAQQAGCERLRIAESQNNSLMADAERRKGMDTVTAVLTTLQAKVDSIEEQLSNKVVMLQPRILYLLLAGFTGVGLAGRDAISAILKWFGFGAGG